MDITSEISEDLLRIPFQELHDVLTSILLKNGFARDKEKTCAEIFVQNTCDGSTTHGVSRFPRFIQQIKNGSIDVQAGPEFKRAVGCIEQWDGHLGPGPLNALFCTRRAMEIALTGGIGCIGLANTNHWMRGGYYARMAASEGYLFIGWTNTMALMPAWGAKDKRLGNNPLVMGVPFAPSPLVLDMAMSQFSYGSLETKALRGEKLSHPGGYAADGELTADPSEILSSGRPLPMGYWKGSGLALFLDILAAALSGGSTTREISSRSTEYGVSQVFVAIHAASLSTENNLSEMIRSIVEDVRQSIPIDPNSTVRYPGEHVLRIRKQNDESGIPVDRAVWSEISLMQ